MRITISGTLIGPIWWPAGAKYLKNFEYVLEREDKPFSNQKETGDFEYHLEKITNDGDFQHCLICEDAVVTFHGETYTKDHRVVTTKRVFNLAEFPSAKPFLTDEFPEFDDDED